MNEFTISIDKVKLEKQNIVDLKGNLNGYLNEILVTYHAITLGTHTAQVKNSLDIIKGQMKAEIADMDHLSNILGQILTCYMNAEEILAGVSVEKEHIENTDTLITDKEQPDNSENRNSLENPFREWGITDDEWKYIQVIISFIPGLNCIADLYTIVVDIKAAYEDDGEFSWNEILGIGIDVAIFAVDTISAVQLAKTIYKGVKTAKLAQTAAKAADKEVIRATEAAEKATKKAAQSTETAEKAAEKIAKAKSKKAKSIAAKASKKASKTAKEDIKAAAKAMTNKATKERKAAQAKKAVSAAKKQGRDNVKKEFFDGMKGNIKSRYKPISKVKDNKLILSTKGLGTGKEKLIQLDD